MGQTPSGFGFGQGGDGPFGNLGELLGGPLGKILTIFAGLQNPAFGAIAGGVSDIFSAENRNQDIDDILAGTEASTGQALENLEGITPPRPIVFQGGRLINNGGLDAATLEGMGLNFGGLGGQSSLAFAQRVAEATGRRLINLDETFDTGQTTFDFLQAQPDFLGQGLAQGRTDLTSAQGEFERTLNEALSRTAGLFQGARTSQGELLTGVDLPDTDLSAVLNAQIGGIDALGEARTQLRQQEAAASSRSLEESQRDIENIGFREGRQSRFEAQQAGGLIRTEEAQRETDVAGLQAQASNLAATLNAQLATNQSAQQNVLSQGLATGQGQFGQALSGLESFFAPLLTQQGNLGAALAGGAEQDDVNALLFQQGLEGTQFGQDFATTSPQLGAAQFLGGLGLQGQAGMQDILALQTFMDSITQFSNLRNAGDSGGTSFAANINPFAALGPAVSGAAGFGRFLPSGFGSDMIASDRDLKQDFETHDPEDTLKGLASLDISTWAYKADPKVRHLGPMAQDIQTVFGVGDGKTLNPVDMFGIVLSAFKGLVQRLDRVGVRTDLI